MGTRRRSRAFFVLEHLELAQLRNTEVCVLNVQRRSPEVRRTILTKSAWISSTRLLR